MKRFYLVQFLYERERILRSVWAKGSFKGASEVADLREGTAGFARVVAGLERMRDDSAGHDAKLMVAIWPMFEHLGGRYPFEEQHALVQSTLRRLKIASLDLLDTFRGLDETTLWVQRSDHHPNASAQKLAAESVLAELKRRGFTPG